MKCAFHPDARLEYREAAAFYEARQVGLGELPSPGKSRLQSSKCSRPLNVFGSSSRMCDAVLPVLFPTEFCTRLSAI
jgi:hypothetical protein